MASSPQDQARGLLLAYLESLRGRGRSHVHVPLSLLQRLSQRDAASLQVAVKSSLPPAAPGSAPQMGGFQRTGQLRAGPTVRELRPLVVEGDSASRGLEDLAARASSMLGAMLQGGCGSWVSGAGALDAKLFIVVDEVPVEGSDAAAMFAAPQGEKLSRVLAAMGLAADRVFLTPLIKVPALARADAGWPAAAMELCASALLTEIDLIKPRVLLLMGQRACAALGLGTAVQALRGRVHEFRGLKAVVSHPPDYLIAQERLADGGLRAKRECWEDMLQVMESLGLSISEKQRGYFRR